MSKSIDIDDYTFDEACIDKTGHIMEFTSKKKSGCISKDKMMIK